MDSLSSFSLLVNPDIEEFIELLDSLSFVDFFLLEIGTYAFACYILFSYIFWLCYFSQFFIFI